MMIKIGIFALPFLAAGSMAAAAPPNHAPNHAAAAELRAAMDQMVTDNQPPGQSKRPSDPDQGDDNAAMRAIVEVCNKGTPAAERSAICPAEPISPH